MPSPEMTIQARNRRQFKQGTKRLVDPTGYFEIWDAYGVSKERETQILLTAVLTRSASFPYRWCTNAAAGLGQGRA